MERLSCFCISSLGPRSTFSDGSFSSSMYYTLRVNIIIMIRRNSSKVITRTELTTTTRVCGSAYICFLASKHSHYRLTFFLLSRFLLRACTSYYMRSLLSISIHRAWPTCSSKPQMEICPRVCNECLSSFLLQVLQLSTLK